MFYFESVPFVLLFTLFQKFSKSRQPPHRGFAQVPQSFSASPSGAAKRRNSGSTAYREVNKTARHLKSRRKVMMFAIPKENANCKTPKRFRLPQMPCAKPPRGLDMSGSSPRELAEHAGKIEELTPLNLFQIAKADHLSAPKPEAQFWIPRLKISQKMIKFLGWWMSTFGSDHRGKDTIQKQQKTHAWNPWKLDTVWILTRQPQGEWQLVGEMLDRAGTGTAGTEHSNLSTSETPRHGSPISNLRVLCVGSLFHPVDNDSFSVTSVDTFLCGRCQPLLAVREASLFVTLEKRVRYRWHAQLERLFNS